MCHRLPGCEREGRVGSIPCVYSEPEKDSLFTSLSRPGGVTSSSSSPAFDLDNEESTLQTTRGYVSGFREAKDREKFRSRRFEDIYTLCVYRKIP